MLMVRRSPLALSSLFELPVALSALRTVETTPASPRRGEVTEEDDRYTLTISVPGLGRDDLTLNVTDTTLSLEGVRSLEALPSFAQELVELLVADAQGRLTLE